MASDLLHLTEAAGRGDRQAIDQLLERFLPELRAYIRLRAGPLIRQRESSSDLVQSVCREVLEHAERFKFPSETAFKHWLFTTALRKLANRRDYYLAQKRDAGREVSLEPADESSSGTGLQEADRRLLESYRVFASPSAEAAVREELERVEAAFDGLSEEQREVVTLAHLVGLTRAEIAEELGKSEGAVRVTLHRALAKLSGLLQGGSGQG